MPKRKDKQLLEMLIQRMQELRNEHHYSQEYVTEKTHLNIAQFEASITAPSLVSLAILCEFYGITLAEFFLPILYPTKNQNNL